MAWNNQLPASNEKIRNLSAVITNNWLAIEQGNAGLLQWAIVLKNRSVAPVSPVNPAAIADAGILFAKTSGSAVELFFQRPTGSPVQITGAGSVAANGYSFLPGGAIMQWGSATLTGGAGAGTVVTLPLAYPTAILSVNVTVKKNASNDKYVTWGTPTLTTFTIYKEQADQPLECTWMAIGH